MNKAAVGTGWQVEKVNIPLQIKYVAYISQVFMYVCSTHVAMHVCM